MVLNNLKFFSVNRILKYSCCASCTYFPSLQFKFVVLLLSNETGASPPQPRDHTAVKRLHVKSWCKLSVSTAAHHCLKHWVSKMGEWLSWVLLLIASNSEMIYWIRHFIWTYFHLLGNEHREKLSHTFWIHPLSSKWLKSRSTVSLTGSSLTPSNSATELQSMYNLYLKCFKLW